MSFQPGDTVTVIDEAITGQVTAVHSTRIEIRTADGFTYRYRPDELIGADFHGTDWPFEESDLHRVLREKERPARKKPPPKKPKKQRTMPPMEVDLHIENLVASARGMSNFEMLNLQLDTAKHRLEFAIKKKIRRVVFIHGVGQGVLKAELLRLLSGYEQVQQLYDADYRKYGRGATEVLLTLRPQTPPC